METGLYSYLPSAPPLLKKGGKSEDVNVRCEKQRDAARTLTDRGLEVRVVANRRRLLSAALPWEPGPFGWW